MLSCSACYVLHAHTTTGLCSVCHAPLTEAKTGRVNVVAKPRTCATCDTPLGPHGRRFCSSYCRNRAKYLYTKDPVAYAHLGPSYERPDVRERHIERQQQIEAGLLSGPNARAALTTNPTATLNLNNVDDVFWALIDNDTPTLRTHKLDTAVASMLNGVADRPATYAHWRATQNWASNSTLAERLSALTGITSWPTLSPAALEEGSAAGTQCVCSLCDKQFVAPFPTDICPECL